MYPLRKLLIFRRDRINGFCLPGNRNSIWLDILRFPVSNKHFSESTRTTILTQFDYCMRFQPPVQSGLNDSSMNLRVIGLPMCQRCQQIWKEQNNKSPKIKKFNSRPKVVNLHLKSFNTLPIWKLRIGCCTLMWHYLKCHFLFKFLPLM